MNNNFGSFEDLTHEANQLIGSGEFSVRCFSIHETVTVPFISDHLVHDDRYVDLSLDPSVIPLQPSLGELAQALFYIHVSLAKVHDDYFIVFILSSSNS